MYPEIQQLKDFFTTHSVEITHLKYPQLGSGLKPVHFKCRNDSVIVHIKDEYADLLHNNPLLNLLLVLNELSMIAESTDFLNWCAENDVDARSEALRTYYQDILGFVTLFKTFFPKGEIDCFISDLDFQLNAGAAQYLRAH